jgi:tRNA (cmo5U34)-methyltransferase
MSAIHHHDADEKQSLFARCYEALLPGGTFINGDEYRPESDAEYVALLEDWSAHMHSALERGDIPAFFKDTLDYWHNRNIRRFREPKQSGDDCHETVAAQLGYLLDVGFEQAQSLWAKELWAVVIANKPVSHSQV